MSNDATWGFGMGGIEEQEGGFENPPVGHYTMEIIEIKGPTNNKSGDLYVIPICEILEADDDEWVGRKYSPYMSLTEARVGYTKLDLRRMGASDECLSDDGNPHDLEGLVFTVDLVQNKGYINMRNIEAVTGEPEPEKEKPKPKRRGGGSRR